MWRSFERNRNETDRSERLHALTEDASLGAGPAGEHSSPVEGDGVTAGPHLLPGVPGGDSGLPELHHPDPDVPAVTVPEHRAEPRVRRGVHVTRAW